MSIQHIERADSWAPVLSDNFSFYEENQSEVHCKNFQFHIHILKSK